MLNAMIASSRCGELQLYIHRLAASYAIRGITQANQAPIITCHLFILHHTLVVSPGRSYVLYQSQVSAKAN
jgi:hypothetical protein